MAQESFLLKNLVLFGHLLRAAGMDVGPGQIIDLAAALEHIELGQREDFYHAARAIMVNRHADFPLFDLAFNLFWRARSGGAVELPSLPQDLPPSNRPPRAPGRAVSSSDPSASSAPETERLILEIQQTYSADEVLRKKDFGEFTERDEQDAKELLAAMRWRTGERRTRRRMPAPHGTRLDMRRMVRRNLKYGGEFLDLVWKRPRFKPRPLVVLCDISGSMENYSRLLLHFIHTLSNGMDRVEAFLFGTRLTRITRQLRQNKDIDAAVREVVHAVDDWGGGTRIGEAIKAFNYLWVRRVRAQRAVVLLISDGWDRGDTEMLGKEMARLQRSCHRLIWLNPLLASPGYEPLTRGLQAALPYVDDFLPCHNLNSLQALALLLSQPGDPREAPPNQDHGSFHAHPVT